MKNRLLDNERFRRASLYITAAALCVLFLCVFYEIWRADLRVPFFYSGDSLFYSMFIRTIIDNGWYWQNPAIGAPGGLLLYDFPGLDNSVAVPILLLSIFTSNAMLVLNIFYLLTYPLAAVASFYVLRQFNFSFAIALLCSLLYAFLPYHFMRNETHFLLSAYWVVPLAVLVVLWIMSAELVPRSKKFLIAVLICILLGSSGIYYPFFFCFLLVIGGVAGSLRFLKLKPLVLAFVFIAITCGMIIINLSPSIIYKYKHGDVGVTIRSASESERYGLRISQMVLPISGHRINRLAHMKFLHNQSTLVTENETATLGFIGTIGFLALLAQLLHRKEFVPHLNGRFQDLSILNVFAVLLGLIGGIGFLFAVLVTPGLRSINRISTYIAFFSLMAVGFALESIYRRLTKGRAIFNVLVIAALILGFLDQTTPGYIPRYTDTKTEFQSDADFVQRVERSVPAGSMIFQLPYVQFPEAAGIHHMHDYDHFRGYLHSKHLRWSYGTIKNRDGDRAQAEVAALPTEQFVQALVYGGFSGIYLDRDGYEDGAAAKSAELSNVIHVEPLVSQNGRLLFFNLGDYARRLRENTPDDEWQAKQDRSFHPLLLDWKGGFSHPEESPGKTWRWCSNEGELHLRNMSRRPRTISLEMAFATGFPEPTDLTIRGLLTEDLKVARELTPFSKEVVVPPGDSIITFRSAARRIEAPGDPRFLVFRIENFKLTELQ